LPHQRSFLAADDRLLADRFGLGQTLTGLRAARTASSREISVAAKVKGNNVSVAD